MRLPFNSLIDALPETCTVNDREYPVNTDFRNVLAFIRLQNGDERKEVKNNYGFSLFFGDVVHRDDIEGLGEWLKYFLSRGEEDREDNGKAPVFDILIDSGRVYAAFMQIYGINLRRVKIHWWIFKELLDGLPGGTKLADVVEIRQRPFDKYMRPSEKNELQRQKDYYRIGKKVDAMDLMFSMMRSIAK